MMTRHLASLVLSTVVIVNALLMGTVGLWLPSWTHLAAVVANIILVALALFLAQNGRRPTA